MTTTDGMPHAACFRIRNAKIALAHLRAVAKKLGFTCYAKAWLGVSTKDTFECGAGHRFERWANYILLRAHRCAAGRLLPP